MASSQMRQPMSKQKNRNFFNNDGGITGCVGNILRYKHSKNAKKKVFSLKNTHLVLKILIY